ncbi:hypothetical protein JF531_05640 [Microbacterium esteraromaticum]|uniref:hypothetical protein n=1 Tax=Microbacterium esteraromaticum TaxID=57043 RepID=UPI001A8D7C22|nr:hypothetical protein [Microbacterium esteraromaticum]MBN8424000.1 hypothetical protein [Microbacterium esteraromaticum]
MDENSEQGAARPRRLWFALAAALAVAVAVVFATIGDGVEAEVSGFAGWIIDHAHTAVWVLLAAALAIAAFRGAWTRAAGVVAVIAGLVYAVFLVTLFTVG